MNLWEKVGSIVDIGSLGHVLFRVSGDMGNPKIKISEDWYVWRINDDNFTRVGKLEGEYQKTEIGLVINPESIVYRMRTGEYDLKLI